MRWSIMLTVLIVVGPESIGAADQSESARDVFVVGALHGLHQSEESFTFDLLRQIIEAIRPDVLVLEVRPDELAERKDTPGRPEYPRVIWPLLAGSRSTAVAMEPGGEPFSEITGQAAAEMKAFATRDRNGAKHLSSYQRSVDAVLQAYWRHPADTHNAVTSDLARSSYIVQRAVVGDTFATIQTRWDQFMVDEALNAIQKAPGKRVLVLCSYRNRQRFEDAIGVRAADRLVDMEQWVTPSISIHHSRARVSGCC